MLSDEEKPAYIGDWILLGVALVVLIFLLATA